MKDFNNKYLVRIRQMAKDFMKDEDARVYLFGSWARGEQRQSSDVDIAICYDELKDKNKIAALRELFEESSIPYRVDVVDMKFASESLLRGIKKDGILWN